MGGDRGGDARLLARIDHYLDARPRVSADVVEVGRLRAFVSRVAWPYYARPRPELTGPVDAADVRDASATLTAAGRPVAFEWVDELTPSMSPATAAAGLDVTMSPLLVLGDLDLPEPSPGVRIVVCGAEDEAVLTGYVVATLSFDNAGTDVGPVGVIERDAGAAACDPAEVDDRRRRIEDGSYVNAVAVDDVAGVVGSAVLLPVPDVPDVAEIVAVAVLPSHRRRGIGAMLAASLAEVAARQGVEVVMLSAASEDVARVYERIGFFRVGHHGTAEPPP